MLQFSYGHVNQLNRSRSAFAFLSALPQTLSIAMARPLDPERMTAVVSDFLGTAKRNHAEMVARQKRLYEDEFFVAVTLDRFTVGDPRDGITLRDEDCFGCLYDTDDDG